MAVLNLNRSLKLSSSRSFMFFHRVKEPKRPARGKTSQALLCSGIAVQYPSVKEPLPLEQTFCFTALRNLCGTVL